MCSVYLHGDQFQCVLGLCIGICVYALLVGVRMYTWVHSCMFPYQCRVLYIYLTQRTRGKYNHCSKGAVA